jgi:hypothetical protein
MCGTPLRDLSLLQAEMQNCAEEYCEYVLQQLEAAKQYCPDPMIFIEQKLDFSHWVENGFGTGDCVILADKVLQIIDYKHGLGVLVEAENNSQMMCYALGALEAFGDLYDIDQCNHDDFPAKTRQHLNLEHQQVRPLKLG